MAEKEQHKAEQHKIHGKEDSFSAMNPVIIGFLAVAAVLLLINQWQISAIAGGMGHLGAVKKVDAASVYEIKSTSQAVATLFPVEEISSIDDAIALIIPQGTPEYGNAYGISFDDPVNSLSKLAGAYNAVKQDVKTNNPDAWQRYLNLASRPVGISCEFCCGIGAQGITSSGELRCGCSHNPAVQTLTMLLMKDTEMDDAEILTEVMRWKSLWFPRDMVNLAVKAAGGEVTGGQNADGQQLPGMVGGC